MAWLGRNPRMLSGVMTIALVALLAMDAGRADAVQQPTTAPPQQPPLVEQAMAGQVTAAQAVDLSVKALEKIASERR